MYSNLPTGQSSVLHTCLSDPVPKHVAPPLDGAVLLQSLERDCVPPPQGALQASQAAQSPNLLSKNSFW